MLGWLRPVFEARREQAAVAAVLPDRRAGKPHLRERAAELPQRSDARLALGDFPEAIVAEIKLAARQSGPGDAFAGQVAFERSSEGVPQTP